MVRTLMLQLVDRMRRDRSSHLAMLGLIVDDLTVPELLAPHQLDALIDTMVTRLLPV
ncbi:hypothetical protein AB0D42_08115 [Streptomyces sp. NPDC048304]|uniref:hypothetical protein n=1 Tax=Streptomyces sp. NPDC048304 TaxID=3154820 RepID=UPI0033F14BD8